MAAGPQRQQIGGTAISRGNARRERVAPSTLQSNQNPVWNTRPVGVSQVLDGSMRLFRFRFTQFVALAACLYLPVRILDILLVLRYGTDANFDEDFLLAIVPLWGAVGQAKEFGWVTPILIPIILSILGIATGRMVAQLSRGHTESTVQLLSYGLKRSWVAVLIVAISMVVRIPTVATCFVVLIFVEPLLFMASAGSGVGHLGPWKSFRRAWKLARACYSQAMGIYIGGLVISLSLRVSLTAGPLFLIANFVSSSTVQSVLMNVVGSVVLVVEPLTAVIAARAYIELSNVRFGTDLYRRIEGVGP